ncbi:MAG: amino acid adenylation domain-containing protein, partial [Bacteroidota bacterium]
MDQRSNQLAHYLQSEGVQTGEFVGLCLDRSFEAIIGILGILKAGAVYVPIAANSPNERIQFVIDNGALAFVVCNTVTMMSFFEMESVKLILLEEGLEALSAYPKTACSSNITATSLAYMMYTSGSLGTPKGVVIKHQSIVHLILNDDFEYLNEQSVLYQFAPLSFDASTFEIWGALLKGGRLAIASPGHKSLEDIHLELEKYGVNVLWLTAGLFHLAMDNHVKLFRNLRYLLAGGDSIHPASVLRLKKHYPDLVFINGYGPTESTTFAVMHRVNELSDLKDERNIIGRPIGHTKAYVLSLEGNHLMPIGRTGELCLSGPRLSPGYHSAQALTREKFWDNPFDTGAYDKLYRTGDIVRWLEDGRLEFIGRKDHQVKVRGYRIEPGEIEKALDRTMMVKQAVVVVKSHEQNEKKLLAYVVPGPAYSKTALQANLSSQLPSYMLPAAIIEVDDFPLTKNGKIDRTKLPEPDRAILLDHQFVAPQTVEEKELALLWKDLLHLEQVGIHDNFFDLGGHSLLAIRLLAAIKETRTVEMTITDVFERPTIGALAKQLEQSNLTKPTDAPLEKMERPALLPLSFAQERLWFIHNLTGSSHYHISFVQGFNDDLDKDALAYAFIQVVNRHEVLRTVFQQKDGQAYQVILEKDNWQMDYVEYDEAHETDTLNDLIANDIHPPFNLSTDHMIRVKLYKKSTGGFVLVIVVHHIAFDGWSRSVLLNEVFECYHAKLNNRPIPLQSMDIQYADYVLWQREHLSGDYLEKELDFWEKQLAGHSSLKLPTDFARPAIQSTKGKSMGFLIKPDLSEQLYALAKKEGVTLYMLLLAAFKVLLSKYSGQTDICVGSPIANREQKQIDRLIGFFVNTLVIRTNLEGNPAFTHLLAQVRATTLEAYKHQDTPFEKIVERLNDERDMSTNPIVQVVFALQNAPSALTLEKEEEVKSTEQMKTEDAALEATTQSMSKFDLTFGVVEMEGEIQCSAEYCTALFNDETIARMCRHYVQLLEAIVHHPDSLLSELSLLSTEERNIQLFDFNQTASQYPAEDTIGALFSAQAKRTPDQVALSYEGKAMTYRELDEQSNQLANYLVTQGVKPQDRIGVYMNRSCELVLSILAIVKTGAAYVPLDIEYPVERIKWMLEDAEVKVILSNAFEKERLAGLNQVSFILVDEPDLLKQESVQSPVVNCSSLDPIYLMYTSGSSGQPKGVVIQHQSVARLIFNPDFEYLDSTTVL